MILKVYGLPQVTYFSAQDGQISHQTKTQYFVNARFARIVRFKLMNSDLILKVLGLHSYEHSDITSVLNALVPHSGAK